MSNHRPLPRYRIPTESGASCTICRAFMRRSWLDADGVCPTCREQFALIPVEPAPKAGLR